ncbi:DinI-like family protein [Edwardsiella piscicida]|uniref:DinI-like family protein n=1 Tax=Edwardsiella piscicida TaxID=1263550 RepID=UPI00370D815F
MKVEVTIDRNKKLPDGAIPALQQELQKRLSRRYDNCDLIVRRAGADGLSVSGSDKVDKKLVEEILQETWESADDWFDEH